MKKWHRKSEERNEKVAYSFRLWHFRLSFNTFQLEMKWKTQKPMKHNETISNAVREYVFTRLGKREGKSNISVWLFIIVVKNMFFREQNSTVIATAVIISRLKLIRAHFLIAIFGGVSFVKKKTINDIKCFPLGDRQLKLGWLKLHEKRAFSAVYAY